MKSDKIKLIVAIAIFAVAALLIAYQLFSGGGSSDVEVKPIPPGEAKGGPRAITPPK